MPKGHYICIIRFCLGTLCGIFITLFANCIYLPLLLYFFPFQIKTCGFHLKEEGKELLGMLMTALANNNGYCVLLSALCQKSWQDCLLNASIATSNKNSNLQKSQSVNCIGAIDTCQLLMLTKCVNCYLKFSCLLTKVLQMCQKQLTHLPIQCIMQYKHNVLLRTCHLNYSIDNVSIVSHLCTIINYTNTLTKLTLMHTCMSGIGW